jgi:hypothetical protein
LSILLPTNFTLLLLVLASKSSVLQEQGPPCLKLIKPRKNAGWYSPKGLKFFIKFIDQSNIGQCGGILINPHYTLTNISCLLIGGGEITNNLHTTIVSLNTNYIIFRNVENLKETKFKEFFFCKETSEFSGIFF